MKTTTTSFFSLCAYSIFSSTLTFEPDIFAIFFIKGGMSATLKIYRESREAAAFEAYIFVQTTVENKIYKRILTAGGNAGKIRCAFAKI